MPEEGKFVTVNKESLKKNDSILSCYYLKKNLKNKENNATKSLIELLVQGYDVRE